MQVATPATPATKGLKGLTMANDTPTIDLDGAQRLAAAVLTGAVTDALSGAPDAIYWLYSSQAAYYANMAGYDETGHLVTVARRCQPGRRIVRGRLNPSNFRKALAADDLAKMPSPVAVEN